MTSFALRALRAYRRLETRPETPPYYLLSTYTNNFEKPYGTDRDLDL